jgi:hypothetical protein
VAGMAEHDSPWKEALEHLLPSFLAFFYPTIHHDLDWQRGLRESR